jgi:hypothetical protein
MGLVFAGAGLLMAPYLALGSQAWLVTPGGVGVVCYLGVVATAVAYLLYAHGLRCLPVHVAATLTLAEPACATILGVAALGNHLTAPAWGGLGLLGLALLGSAMPTMAGPRPRGRHLRGRHPVEPHPSDGVDRSTCSTPPSPIRDAALNTAHRTTTSSERARGQAADGLRRAFVGWHGLR